MKRRYALLIAGLGGAIACEQRPQRAPAETAAVVVPLSSADTVVRKVYRVSRRPSAIQRVTGHLSGREAGRVIDSILAVRVLDQRGAGLGAVSVRWSIANAVAGAELRVLDAITDSTGISRATFTPGASGDVQTVTAEVADVGRIDFSVTIPAASIRIVPKRHLMWATDEMIFGVELRDVAGNLLPGGSVSWATTDTSVVRVRADDASHARVTGALAGHTGLVGWVGAGEMRDTARVTVRPIVAGRFITLDGGPPPRMRLEVRAGQVRESIAVDGGSFSKRAELPLEVDVELGAAAITDTAAYQTINLLIAPQRELQTLVIVLVPTAVRLQGGTYAGREVAIDARKALRRSGPSAPFWRLVPISGRGPRKLLGWRYGDFPLRIAFDRSRSNEPITDLDSIAFWAIARQMEQDLGAPFFVPAQMADSGGRGVVPVEITAQQSEAHTFVSWAQEGDANNAVMLFRREATLRDSHVVTHELVHLLGFGHSAAWRTIAQPAGSPEPRLTPDDVAYMQLAMRLRRIQDTSGARPGLPVAVQ